MDPEDEDFSGDEEGEDEDKTLGIDQNLLPGVDKDTTAEAFAKFDTDGNGFLGASEIKYFLNLIGEVPNDEDIDEMIKMIDDEGNGQIGLDEFQELFRTSGVVREMQKEKMAAYEGGKGDTGDKNKTGDGKKKLEVQDAVSSIVDAVREQEGDEDEPLTEKEARANYDLLKYYGMGPKQLKKYYERFLQFDSDGSGTLSYEEFLNVVEEDDSELLRRLFDLFDTDRGGSIDMHELLLGLSSYVSTTSKEERLRFAFKILDLENHGSLDKEGVAKIIRANFLAYRPGGADIRRRVDKIFKVAGCGPKEARITFGQFLEVANRVSGLIFPAFALVEGR